MRSCQRAGPAAPVRGSGRGLPCAAPPPRSAAPTACRAAGRAVWLGGARPWGGGGGSGPVRVRVRVSVSAPTGSRHAALRFDGFLICEWLRMPGQRRVRAPGFTARTKHRGGWQQPSASPTRRTSRVMGASGGTCEPAVPPAGAVPPSQAGSCPVWFQAPGSFWDEGEATWRQPAAAPG